MNDFEVGDLVTIRAWDEIELKKYTKWDGTEYVRFGPNNNEYVIAKHDYNRVIFTYDIFKVLKVTNERCVVKSIETGMLDRRQSWVFKLHERCNEKLDHDDVLLFLGSFTIEET